MSIVSLESENDITWLVPTCTLPRYVREVTVLCARRRGPIKHGGRVVGWANLHAKAQSRQGHFLRRVFWLASHDPYEGGGAPVEGVDPLSVVPGRAGSKTERSIVEPTERNVR